MPSPTERDFAKWWKHRGRDELTLVLWGAWDPIGGGVPIDEYADYSDRLMSLLRKAPMLDEVAAELARLRTGIMGAPDDPQKPLLDPDRAAAEKLLDWYHWAVEGGDWNDDQHPPPGRGPWRGG